VKLLHCLLCHFNPLPDKTGLKIEVGRACVRMRITYENAHLPVVFYVRNTGIIVRITYDNAHDPIEPLGHPQATSNKIIIAALQNPKASAICPPTPAAPQPDEIAVPHPGRCIPDAVKSAPS